VIGFALPPLDGKIRDSKYQKFVGAYAPQRSHIEVVGRGHFTDGDFSSFASR
jgi:hypothetical protein